jgi:hypothetical protein
MPVRNSMKPNHPFPAIFVHWAQRREGEAVDPDAGIMAAAVPGSL